MSTNRDARFNAARIGMLRKVSYPTGGYTTFMYEPHKYISKVTRDMTHQNNPYALDLPDEEIAGGVRIAQIKDYTTPTNFTTRTFYYNKAGAKGNPGKCSGILLHSPHYFLWHKQDRPDYLNCLPYPDDRYHIGYSEVMEKFSDGSYNVYNFTNYKSNPDVTYYEYLKDFKYRYSTSMPSDALENLHLQAQPYSCYLQRGKLASFKRFSANNTLKYQEENTRPYKSLRYIVCVRHTMAFYYMYKEYVETYPLVTKEITKYSENGVDRTQYSYTYNQLGQLTSEIVSRAGRVVRGYKKVYPIDLAATDPIAFAMCQANLYASPLYEYETDEFSYITNAKKYTYKLDNFWGNISLAEIGKLKTPAEPIKELNSGRFSLETSFIYSSPLNRLMQTKDKNNVPTSYLWGYGNLYPVAVGKNLFRSTFTTDMVDPRDGTLLESEEKRLRQLPNAQLTTYKYIPYVGISKETNPRGESITYDYNEHGKLKAVYKFMNPVCSYEYSTDYK